MKLKSKQLTIEEIQKRLATFERRYSMTSAEFEQKYQTGSMGDSEEVMAWIRDYESYKILLAREAKKKKAARM